MYRPLIIFILAFVFLLAASEARAAGAGTCNAYVEAAVKAAQEVREHGCGGRDPGDSGDGRLALDHPQWSTDRNVHRRWCLTASDEDVKNETVQREGQLNQCRTCDQYSFEATTLGRAARTLSCGFNWDHPVWSEDRGTHMRWCMASRAQSLAGETNHRQKQIAICQDCQNYGKLARDQALEAEKLKCRGLTGPRWGTSMDGHVRWCIGEKDRARSFHPLVGADPEPSHTNDETNARAGDLARCKQEAKVTQGLKKGAAGAAPYAAVPRKKETAATKPVQAARKPSEQPYAAKQRVPSSGSGSSAMDRLGPGGPSGTASAGAASAVKPRGSSSAAAPASSATGGGGGVAPPATTINRNAIGGGSPERIR